MECHEARMLLAFTRPGSDAMDAAERAEVQQHLESCPECAVMALSEQAVDGAFGKAMREVPVPAGLQQRVLAKVAANRPYPWPAIAAAAAILMLVAGAGTWLLWPLPRVDTVRVQDDFNRDTDPDSVEAWFKKQGVEMEAWRQLDHRHLLFYDIGEFHGRRVARLVFFNRDRPAVAEVFVLPVRRFNTRDLTDGFPGQTNRIFVHRESNLNFVYVVGTSEQTLDAFLLRGAQ
jgi:hypothetical protein